jgi:hypothetical protein
MMLCCSSASSMLAAVPSKSRTTIATPPSTPTRATQSSFGSNVVQTEAARLLLESWLESNRVAEPVREESLV